MPNPSNQPAATYAVQGMTCSHCERSVQEEVEALPGVTAARADHASGTVVVTGKADADAVAAAVQAAGYEIAR